MTDADLFALLISTEAAGQPYEGKVAVARVVYNRMAQLYESDGTVPGTALKYDQFSDFYFDWVNGHYSRVCDTQEEAAVRAEVLLPEAQEASSWPDCVKAVGDGVIGSAFPWGPQGLLLDNEPRALMYVNLEVSQPAWATDDKRVCKIYAHTFYRA